MSLLTAYEKLTHLYPKSYRETYGPQMVQTLADMLHDQPNSRARGITWTKAVLDLPINIIKQNFMVMEAIYTTETPQFVRRNSQISVFLLAPFFILVTLNEILPSALPQTATWDDILQFLVAGMPGFASLLCVATFFTWAAAEHRQNRKSVWHNLRGIRSSWPLVTVGVLSLMIVAFMLGHDSVHCVMGNPVKEVRNLNATFLCLRQD
jgi:hypothetical protein